MRSATDHNYTRGYEWWLMREARKRNPAIILDTLAWGAPGWIGNGTFYSHDMAEYVADFLSGAKKQGLEIEYTGVWNERTPDFAWVKAASARPRRTSFADKDRMLRRGCRSASVGRLRCDG